MSNILNPEYQESVVYNNEELSETQMYTDASTVSAEDETIFKQFAKRATEYVAKVSKKKKHYDWKTKNKSFLDLYQDLYKLGVKNNKFFLRIFDTDLIGVDPYSPVLPKDMQIKIFIECMINPWYWLREVLRIPVDGLPIEPGGGVPYRIDRCNVACWYLFLNGIDHYSSKPRQQGKTQDCVAKFNYAYHFANMSSTMLFFNKDQDQANMNLYRLKCQRDMFPSWMQMRYVVSDSGKVEKGIDNTKSIRNPVNDNVIMTMGKATSKDSAMRLGRGSSSALIYFDEFDFIPYQTEIINAASFAYSTAAKNAAANGSLYGRVFSSTPGDLDNVHGQTATEYVSHMLQWNDHMFDTDIKELKKIISGPSYNRVVFVEFSWRQLKLPMSWYEEQCGLVSFNTEVIMREIELKRIHGSSDSPFKRNDILYLMNHTREPIEQIDYSKNLCPILVYEKIKINKVYIMCIDPSEGLAQDNNAMTLIDPSTQKAVAEFRSPYISQPDFCRLLCRFMDERCPRCLIIPESNKGREIINCFLETKYREQLYYDDGKLDKQVIERTDPYGRLKQESIRRRAFGLWTGNNRGQYYAILENLMEERKDILLTKYLVEDICGLIRKPNGRVEAGKGSHDDNIMSYLIGMFVYTQAPYEKLEQYGIRRGAFDPYDDDELDENGKLTEEAQLRQMMELLPSLPENMQELIRNAMKQKNPVKDAENFYKDVDKYRSRYQMDSPMIDDSSFGEDDLLPETQSPIDQNAWSQFDRRVYESNDPLEDPFTTTDENGFDIDDLF